MITELLLIAAAGIIDPMDMSGHQMYPSGFKEVDKYPRYSLPESKLAKITIPLEIISSDGRTIKSGHYLAGLSVSQNAILLFEGEKNIFAVDIDEVYILDPPVKISTAKFYSDTNGEAYILLKDKRFLFKAKVKLLSRID